MSFAFVGD